MRFIPAIIVLLLAPLTPALAETSTSCFVGYAYHLESGEFAYTETHHLTLKNGDPTTWNVTYRDPEGATIALKQMDFTAHPFVPVYRLEILGEGYVEGIGHDDGWTMYRRDSADAALHTKAFAVQASIAGDAGFHPFVQAHFDELMAGDTVHFSFVVAGRLSVIDMQAYRIEDTTFEGQPAVQIKAELDSWLLNWIVNPIILVYDPQSKKLLEYRGISNMHDAHGETYPVRVSYYSEPPPEASQAANYCSAK